MCSFREYYRKQLEQVKQWKKKLYEKTMTLQSFDILYERFLDQFDLLNMNIGTINIINSLVETICGLDIDLPIVFEDLKVNNPLFGYKKAIYGVTEYDQSVYDPEDVWKAIGTLKREFITKVINYCALSHEVPSFSDAFNTSEPYVYNRLHRASLLLTAILNYTICGFTICGFSKLTPPEKRKDGYYGVIYDYRGYKITFKYLLELVFGARCGFEVCGFERIVPRDLIKYLTIVERGKIIDLIYRTIRYYRDQRDRFIFNLTGVKLLSSKPLNLERKVESFGNKVCILKHIEMLTKSFVSRFTTDPLKIQVYIAFVREFVFGKVKKHAMFRKGWNYVNYQKYITYLKQKYIKMGADPNVLDQLINRLITFAQYWWKVSKYY